MTGDDCCSKGVCNNDISNNATAELRTKNKKSIYEFFGHVKSLYVSLLIQQELVAEKYDLY
jgi:hypothetical protein